VFTPATKSQVTKPQVTKPQVTKPQVTKPQVTKPQVTKPQVGNQPEQVATRPNSVSTKPAIPDILKALPPPRITASPESSPIAISKPEVIIMDPQGMGIPKIAGIFVQQFKVTGSSIFSQEKLTQIAAAAIQPEDAKTPTINRVLTPAELVKASEAISKLYIDAKYINSGAYIPEEVLQGSTPEIRIIEGRIEKVNVNIKPAQGFGLNRPLNKRYIESRLLAAAQSPLNLDRLLEATKLLESDPLIGQISVKLEPGTQTGASILNAEVQQAPGFSSSVSVSNARSTSVGSFQQGVTLQQANLLGFGDQLTVGYDRSAGSHSGSFGYSLPVNAKDGRLSFRYNTNGNRIVEERFSDLDITSSSKLFELKFRQPIVRKPNSEFALSLLGTHYRSESQILGDQPLPGRGTDDEGRTRITALRFGQEFLNRDAKQVFSLQSQFSLGINALGATINAEGPDGKFLSWRGRGQYARLLGRDSLFSLRGEVQLANRPLVPVEQLSIGGVDTVRGYRQNSLLTDNGWLASMEVRLPIARFPKSKGVLQLAPFVDMGGGWNRAGESPKPSLLMSAGMGLVLRLGNKFSARLDYGVPLTSTDRNGQSLRQNGPHFSLFYSF
jgi:hemolysin activation/secretion protein